MKQSCKIVSLHYENNHRFSRHNLSALIITKTMRNRLANKLSGRLCNNILRKAKSVRRFATRTFGKTHRAIYLSCNPNSIIELALYCPYFSIEDSDQFPSIAF